jgi:hypothetical protein
MTKKTFFGAMAVVTAVALTGTALVASNMGFKLNYALNQGGAGGSLTGQRTLALPDNRQTGLNDAKGLMDDIGSANVTNVQRWLIGTDVFAQYTGRKTAPSTPFNLVSGEGILVKMLTTVNYIVVGSDDPSLVYQLKNSPGSGQNLYAYNYHQTATDAKSLMDDIGSANVTNIQRWLVGTDVFQQYTGRKTAPSTPFTLTPGEAYLIKMLTTVNYTPSHY